MRSLSFDGPWHDQFLTVINLTSFTSFRYMARITTETFRTFILDNKSFKTLSLEYLCFEGSPNGPPVDLLDLKSLAANLL